MPDTNPPSFQICRGLIRGTQRCGAHIPIAFDRHSQFCCKGCWSSFYRTRCVVCEAVFERKNENQKICDKRKCRLALKKHPELYRPFHCGTMAPPKPLASTDLPESSENAFCAQEVPVPQSSKLSEFAPDHEPERLKSRIPPHLVSISRKMRDVIWRQANRGDDDWELHADRIVGTRKSNKRNKPVARVKQEGDGYWMSYPLTFPEPPIETLEAAKRRAEIAVMQALCPPHKSSPSLHPMMAKQTMEPAATNLPEVITQDVLCVEG